MDFDPFYHEVMKGLGFNFEPTKPVLRNRDKLSSRFTLASMPSIRLRLKEQWPLYATAVRAMASNSGSAVSAAFKAQPFGGVRTILLGAEGEPCCLVHGFFPLSKTKAAALATERFFADNTDLLRHHGIETSYLTCFSGSEFVIEPSFYWFDELGKFRLDLMEPEYRDKWKTIMADREAREVVLRLREELRELFFQHGACSVQIAKFYPYQDRPEKKLRLL
jgi:hypothetical protein